MQVLDDLSTGRMANIAHMLSQFPVAAATPLPPSHKAGGHLLVHDLAKRVKAATSSDSVIELIPYDEAYAEGFEDMMRRVPDLARLKEMTGFSPGRDLTTIIDDVIADKREAD